MTDKNNNKFLTKTKKKTNKRIIVNFQSTRKLTSMLVGRAVQIIVIPSFKTLECEVYKIYNYLMLDSKGIAK